MTLLSEDERRVGRKIDYICAIAVSYSAFQLIVRESSPFPYQLAKAYVRWIKRHATGLCLDDEWLLWDTLKIPLINAIRSSCTERSTEIAMHNEAYAIL